MINLFAIYISFIIISYLVLRIVLAFNIKLKNKFSIEGNLDQPVLFMLASFWYIIALSSLFDVLKKGANKIFAWLGKIVLFFAKIFYIICLKPIILLGNMLENLALNLRNKFNEKK